MKEVFTYKYDDLINPTINALKRLGGSGDISEIEDEVSDILQLSEEEINAIHRGSRTKLNYRLAWARNYLKRGQYIENSSRGVWSLTDKGLKSEAIDKERLKQLVRSLDQRRSKASKSKESVPSEEISSELIKLNWQDELLEIVKKIKPDQFERLCQRLLRELGFTNVEVTGKTNDGGIDGKGLLKLGGVMSFHVVFQAKRYKGSVSSSIVRDFRGAMIGRADKGLIITTGSFTREARREAQRDGAPPIDLINGIELSEKLKELNLGVKIELVEKVSVSREWFKTI